MLSTPGGFPQLSVRVCLEEAQGVGPPELSFATSLPLKCGGEWGKQLSLIKVAWGRMLKVRRKVVVEKNQRHWHILGA